LLPVLFVAAFVNAGLIGGYFVNAGLVGCSCVTAGLLTAFVALVISC